MKRLIFALLAVLLVPALFAQEPASAADTADNAVAPARSAALQLAGAFSNDGYKIRDGFYFGSLEPGKSTVIEVNLFAGNEYWFCAAGLPPARKLAVHVFDEDGNPVEQQSYGEDANAAAGVVAAVSGKYFVKIELVEGEKAPFCFLYCYK